ncbi:hypothetical protein SBV1_80001 [Verrucomicrobia bacterium]|nr:hypothetical protein SBV1_80001 [Verrucomicrobiota bacterium]
MHYNMEGTPTFWCAVAELRQSAAATPLLLAKTFGVGWSGATGHPGMVVFYPTDSSVTPASRATVWQPPARSVWSARSLL